MLKVKEVTVEQEEPISKTVDPKNCPCGEIREVYGKSMDAFYITIVYRCPKCGSMETVKERIK